MNSVIEVLFPRRPVINYVSPAICEFDVSGTGLPVILLEPFGKIIAPGNVFIFGDPGSGFKINWDTTNGDLCYTIYKLEAGELILVAECVTPPEDGSGIPLPTGPGTYVVTAITPDGESPPSEPVTVPNQCPESTDFSVEVTKNTPLSFSLIATDPDSDPLTFSIGAASNGVAVLDDASTGAVTYTPTTDYVGPDSFTFEATDGVCSSSATVSITVDECPGEVGEPVDCDVFSSTDWTGTRYRIKSYSSSVFEDRPENTSTECDVCFTCPFPDGDLICTPPQEWDGTFYPVSNTPSDPSWSLVHGGPPCPTPPAWQQMFGKCISGLLYSIHSGLIISPTGCGWKIEINDYTGTFLLWHGIKTVGSTPEGRYYRVAGSLSTTPECLEIEAY